MIAEAPLLQKQELAEALGISRVTLHQWEKEGADVKGVLQWQLPDAVAYLQEWRKENKRPRYQEDDDLDVDGATQQRLLAAQIRDKTANARKTEIANAERLRELIPFEEVARQAALAMTILTARLEAVPDSLRNKLPEEVRDLTCDIVDHELVLALKECSALLSKAGS